MDNPQANPSLLFISHCGGLQEEVAEHSHRGGARPMVEGQHKLDEFDGGWGELHAQFCHQLIVLGLPFHSPPL